MTFRNRSWVERHCEIVTVLEPIVKGIIEPIVEGEESDEESLATEIEYDEVDLELVDPVLDEEIASNEELSWSKKWWR